MSLGQVWVTTGGLLAAVGLLQFLWAASRIKGVETSLSMMATSNGELREENADLRRSMDNERVECARTTARLEGELKVWMDGLAERIVSATVRALSATDRVPRTRSTDGLD